MIEKPTLARPALSCCAVVHPPGVVAAGVVQPEAERVRVAGRLRVRERARGRAPEGPRVRHGRPVRVVGAADGALGARELLVPALAAREERDFVPPASGTRKVTDRRKGAISRSERSERLEMRRGDHVKARSDEKCESVDAC